MADSTANPEDLRRWVNRVTYGVTPALLDEVSRAGWGAWVEEQLAPDAAADEECQRHIQKARLLIEYEVEPPKEENGAAKTMMMGAKGARKVKEYRPLNLLDKPIEAVFPMYGKDGVPFPEKNRAMEEVMIATMLRAVYSRWQVREMLVEFWHNHFNVNGDKDESIALSLPSYDRTLRTHALGNFRALLESVAKSPAMLYYLDGVESKASPANENFARELFELHTLGVRHYVNHLHTRWREVPGALDGKPEGYIDQDVYEAARAFTGWTVENGAEDDEGVKRPVTGKFMLREAWHDPYQKRVLATEFDSQRPGLEDGMRVLDLVARHPATARFISEKLCRRFVSDVPPETLVEKAAAEFTAAVDAPDQISRVLRVILLSPEFRHAEPGKFKRPLEFLASYLRAAGAEFNPRMDIVYQLENMGQRLFRWGTPTGHPDVSAYWQGGTFLLRRWNLPYQLRDDSWKGIAVFHFLTHTPPDCLTVGQVLDHWSARLIGQLPPEKIRGSLVQILADSDDAKADAAFDGEDRDRDQRLASCIALLAMTPEFQFR